MTPNTYKAALEQAKRELADSIAELGEAQQKAADLERRIVDLRQTISVLSKLCGEIEIELEDALGLTDAIRLVFEEMGNQQTTAQDVRLRLESRGFNTRRYGNLLASIHTVLKRLSERGEIVPSGTIGDKAAYMGSPRGLTPPPGFQPTPRIPAGRTGLSPPPKE